MAAGEDEFKRILVGLHHFAPQHSAQCAAELASLLRLEILGLFVQEESLADLAALPFAREFRLAGGWRRVEREGLSHELDVAARMAQRAFADAVKSLGTAHDFKVVQGSSADAIRSLSRGGDIVVVGEPASLADREILDPSTLVETAFRSASAVVLVPRRVARSTGTVVAIAAGPNDPSVRIARTVAARARSDLIVLEGSPAERYAADAADELRVTRQPVPDLAAQLSHPAGIRSAFRGVHERLIVMRRGVLDRSVPSTIASTRQEPVLIIS
jgi:hypothetical protein